MPTSIRPVLPACRPAPARLLKAMKAILVPGLGPPPRADGAKASKRSHLSHRATRTGPGRRGRLRPERRLVLGFSWSRNCGGFAWALTKAAHAPEGVLAVLQGGRPPQTKSQPQSPSPTVPDPLRPISTQSRARETRKRGRTAAETQKTRRLRRASAVRPPRRGRRGPAPLRRWTDAEKASTQKAERPEPSPRRVTRTATSSFKNSPARRSTR